MRTFTVAYNSFIYRISSPIAVDYCPCGLSTVREASHSLVCKTAVADEARFCGSTDETEERAGAVTKPLSRPNRRNKNGDQDIEQPR